MPVPTPFQSTPAPPSSSPLTLGIWPLELFIYLSTFVGESELIRLSCCSRTLRHAMVRSKFLWTQQLTLNLAASDLADRIRTLYLDRVHGPPGISSGLARQPTHVGRWLSQVEPTSHLTLRSLVVRLHAPQVALDTVHNKLVIVPEEPYWNIQLLLFNLRLVKELMHRPRGPEPDGLRVLEIRLDGQFDQTLACAHEAWLLCQTPWAKTLEEYRLAVGYGLARLPSFALVAIATWMPQLRSFEARIGCPGGQEMHARRHQQRFVLGGNDLAGETTPAVRAAQMAACPLENLHLEGMWFSSNLLLLPGLMGRLRRLVLKSVGWGRMVYELLRRAPVLECLKLVDFCFEQENEEELPADWTFNWDNEDDVSEMGSDDIAIALKAPPITLHHLVELHLIGETTPHIWSVLGECVQNPILRMPRLRKCILDSLDLEEEDQALVDLADLAPKVVELGVRNCLVKDEVDVYHCIRCLPDLEVLDLRMTENITSSLINALALSVPNIRHLDVRGCPYVQATSVARLAETIRDSSDSERRIERVGLDKPLRPLCSLESAQEDGVKWEAWQMWEAWRWLEFTHTLIEEEEYKFRHRFRKDKEVVGGGGGAAAGVGREPGGGVIRVKVTCRAEDPGEGAGSMEVTPQAQGSAGSGSEEGSGRCERVERDEVDEEEEEEEEGLNGEECSSGSEGEEEEEELVEEEDGGDGPREGERQMGSSLRMEDGCVSEPSLGRLSGGPDEGEGDLVRRPA